MSRPRYAAVRTRLYGGDAATRRRSLRRRRRSRKSRSTIQGSGRPRRKTQSEPRTSCIAIDRGTGTAIDDARMTKARHADRRAYRLQKRSMSAIAAERGSGRRVQATFERARLRSGRRNSPVCPNNGLPKRNANGLISCSLHFDCRSCTCPDNQPMPLENTQSDYGDTDEAEKPIFLIFRVS